MDDERFAKLTEPITDMRTIDQVARRPGEAEQLHELSGTLHYPTSLFVALPFHEKRYVLAYAAAQSSSSSVLVSRSAARLWNMWVVATTPETIELTLPSGKASPSRSQQHRYTYRYGKIHPTEITAVRGAAVTNAIRTFVDIARYHGFHEGIVAADCLLRNGYTKQAIRQYMGTLGRKKGIAIARRCLDFAVGNSDSAYESYARALLIEAGIEGIVTQFQIGRFRADLCIGGWLLVEIDGRAKYEGADGKRLVYKDLVRQRDIENQGYVFRRVSPEFLLKHPDRFVADILAVIQARGRGPVQP